MPRPPPPPPGPLPDDSSSSEEEEDDPHQSAFYRSMQRSSDPPEQIIVRAVPLPVDPRDSREGSQVGEFSGGGKDLSSEDLSSRGRGGERRREGREGEIVLSIVRCV